MSTLRVPLRRRLLLRRAVSAGAVALLIVALVPPVALASGTCTLGTVPDGSGTAGTSANPYAVASAADLAKVGVGDCPLSAHYRQTADIVLLPPAPGASNHAPIGAAGDPFTGGFDGAGYVIAGITVYAPDSDEQGMFGRSDGAVLTSVRLVGVSIAGTDEVGGLIGFADDSNIVDSHVTGVVSARFKVGGLVGYALGSGARTVVSNSSAAVTVVASSDSDGSVYEVGGLVGLHRKSDVVRSFATGAVTATGGTNNATSIGGLVGVLSDGSIVSSFATGDVTASGVQARSVGGLVGYGNVVSIDDVFAGGSVSGQDRVGGLAGRLQQAEVSSALAVGRVSALSSPNDVGGLLGEDEEVELEDGTIVENDIFGAFWDATTTGQVSDPAEAAGVVEGLATADLRRFVTFDTADWQIVDGWVPYDALAAPVWGICDGVGYPFLLWRFTSDPCVVAGGSTASGGDGTATTVALAVETAAAAGVAGTSSGVRLRGGESLPVTSRVSGAVGPRGGVVLESEGMAVRVASPLGAREDAGVVLPSSGAFETSVTGALVPGSVVEVWINSAPRLVAAAQVPTSGGPVTIDVPTGAPLDGGDPIVDGAHTLQLRLYTEDGLEIVATGLTIGVVAPMSIPAGEGPAPFGGMLAVVGLLTAAGVAAAVWRGQVVAG